MFLQNSNKKKIFLNLCGALSSKEWRVKFRDLLEEFDLKKYGVFSSLDNESYSPLDTGFGIDPREELDVLFENGVV